MLSLLTIAGGVALILFGVRHLRKGLDRLFGERLGDWLNRLSGNRIKSLLSGIGVSVLAPSSTTMSVLAVQMVQAGHMTAPEMLAVMLGVDIGLTVTVLLISLHLDHAYSSVSDHNHVFESYASQARQIDSGFNSKQHTRF